MTRACRSVSRSGVPAPADDAVVARVHRAVARSLDRVSAPGVVLAVSGGRDSMVLLAAAAAVRPERVACVATFDHGTGDAARRAAALAARRARGLGFEVHRGRAAPWRGGAVRGEAAWREQRWRYLRGVARSLAESPGGLRAGDARAPLVATAHTRDDQVETIFMRALRGAGARGLAGLYAPGSGIVRPLLSLSRADVAAYARAQGVDWVEDPSNGSRDYLRNRVRLDLLPALERARPGMAQALLRVARRAARLRTEVDRFLSVHVRTRADARALAVAAADVLGYDGPEGRLLWPALLAPVGIVLDRRGTERLTQFTINGGRSGRRIQLSGGYEAVLHRGEILVRRARAPLPDAPTELRDRDVRVGAWRVRRAAPGESVPLDGGGAGSELWMAALPADRALKARAWRPGDRMVPFGATAPRRVKGLLRDAGVDAASRIGWPVVLAGNEIVWVPGVRRSSAATVRSGRPVVLYVCERDDG